MNISREEAKQRLEAMRQHNEAMQNEMAELEKIINAPVWEPSKGEFYLNSYGSVRKANINYLFREIIFGNVFKCSSQAKKRALQLRFQNWMFLLAEDLNEGWEPDWSNHSQEKHYLVYNCRNRYWSYLHCYYRSEFRVAYFKDSETARKAIEIIKTWDCTKELIGE